MGKPKASPWQTLWSNNDRGCAVAPTSHNVTIDATPSSATLSPGTSTTFTVTASGNLNSKSTLQAFAPPGVTATFSSTTIRPGKTSTLTLTAASNVVASSGAIYITASDTHGEIHYLTPSLLVNGVAPTLSGIDVGGAHPERKSMAPRKRGTTFTLHGANIGQVATLTVGGTTATVLNPAFDTATLTAVTPSHVTGLTDVVLTNPDGQVVTLPKSFNFTVGSAPLSRPNPGRRRVPSPETIIEIDGWPISALTRSDPSPRSPWAARSHFPLRARRRSSP